jgi:hypothetical protein
MTRARWYDLAFAIVLAAGAAAARVPHGGAPMSGTHAKLRGSAAAGRYAAAFRAQCENDIADVAAGINYETPEFARRNRACFEAEQSVPRWLRWLIDRRILRELDYWNRTGQ